MDELSPRSMLTPEQQRSMQVAAELRQLIEGNVRSGEEMRRVSRMFEIKLRTLYRMRERLKEGALLTPALDRRKPGPKAGSSRFPPEVDNLSLVPDAVSVTSVVGLQQGIVRNDHPVEQQVVVGRVDATSKITPL